MGDPEPSGTSPPAVPEPAVQPAAHPVPEEEYHVPLLVRSQGIVRQPPTPEEEEKNRIRNEWYDKREEEIKKIEKALADFLDEETDEDHRVKVQDNLERMID